MKKIIFIIIIIIIGVSGIIGYIFKEEEEEVYKIETSFGPKLPMEMEYIKVNLNNLKGPKLPIIN